MRTLGLAVLFAVAAGIGCNATSDAPAPAAAIPVEVSGTQYAGLDAALNERKGKVILVDFWATWCGPCVQSFPHFVALHKKYADKGLACMSVSMDADKRSDSFDRDSVLKFLRAKQATFPNFVLLGRGTEGNKIVERFGYEGGIPHQALFDKTGKRVWAGHPEEMPKNLIETELAK